MNRQHVAKKLVTIAEMLTAAPESLTEDDVLKAIRSVRMKAGRVQRMSDGTVIDVRMERVPAQMNKHYKVSVIIDDEGVWVDSFEEPPNDRAQKARDYRHLVTLLKQAKQSTKEILEMTHDALRRSSHKASDPDLEAVAEVVRNNKFLSLRQPLRAIGMRKVDFITGDPPMGPQWRIKTRRGKTIVVINRKYADPDSRDIVVDDFVVGYN